jgi:hypothetical protein
VPMSPAVLQSGMLENFIMILVGKEIEEGMD